MLPLDVLRYRFTFRERSVEVSFIFFEVENVFKIQNVFQDLHLQQNHQNVLFSRYHMGRSEMEGRSIDAVSIASIYKQHFQSEVNVRNLALLMQSYMQA